MNFPTFPHWEAPYLPPAFPLPLMMEVTSSSLPPLPLPTYHHTYYYSCSTFPPHLLPPHRTGGGVARRGKGWWTLPTPSQTPTSPVTSPSPTHLPLLIPP